MIVFGFLDHLSMNGAQVFDWVVSLGNFAIMMFLFNLVVILPMKEAVKLREQRVALRLKEIDKIAAEASNTKAEFEVRFADLDKVVAELKENSERSLAQAKQRLEERTVSEERYVLEKAEAEAESVRREAEASVRSQVASSAVARAEALLSEALDASSQNKILAASIKKMGELNAS